MLIKRDELRNLEIMPASHTDDQLKGATPPIFVKLNSSQTHKFGGCIIVIIQLRRVARRVLDNGKNILRKDCKLFFFSALPYILTFMPGSSSHIVAIPRRFVLYAACRVQTRRCSPVRERLCWESKGTRTAGEWYLLKSAERCYLSVSFSLSLSLALERIYAVAFSAVLFASPPYSLEPKDLEILGIMEG